MIEVYGRDSDRMPILSSFLRITYHLLLFILTKIYLLTIESRMVPEVLTYFRRSRPRKVIPLLNEEIENYVFNKLLKSRTDNGRLHIWFLVDL